MERTRTPALRGWIAGIAYHVATVGPLFGGWQSLGRSLTEGALIALVPAVVVFWVVWLPLRGALARTSRLWRRRVPIALIATAVFGLCGRVAGTLASQPSDVIFEGWGHFSALFALVGLVAAASQDPKDVVPAKDYAQPAFWISVSVAMLALVGVGASLLHLSSDEYNVTTGMSSGAVGLLGLVVCVPLLAVSAVAAMLFLRATRKGRSTEDASS